MVLSRDGTPVPMTPQVFSTLYYLVENAGRTVGREELLGALWPNRIVGEANLSQAISSVRKVLAECDAADLIITLPGKGYRFAADVRREEVAAAPVSYRPAVSGETAGEPARPVGKARPSAWLLAGAAGLVLAVGLFAWQVGRPRPPLAAGRTAIVLADPQNFTGEADFDHVIGEVLRVDLDQSPAFQVASDLKVAETLALMEQPKGAALTLQTARGVCARNNGGAVVAPVIARLHSHYLLAVSAYDCVDGRLLSDEKVEATDKEAVSHLLDGLATRTRSRLGEMNTSIAKFDVPLAPERTSSFEALKAYSQAEWLSRQGKRLDAVPLYNHAIELDPDFAMAYLGLSQAYYSLHQPDKDAEAITKAHDRLASVSERNALLIRDHYDVTVTRDLDAARETMELMTNLYPNDAGAWLTLSDVRYRLADYKGAVAAGEQALRLDPKRPSVYTVLARALNHAEQPARAEQLDDAALKQTPESGQLRQQRIAWRYLQGDDAGGRRLVDTAIGTPFEREALLEGYNFLFAEGRTQAADVLMKRAEELGRLKGLQPEWTEEAANYAHVGRLAEARAALAHVPPDLWNGEDDFYAALLDDPDKAEAGLNRDLKRWPKDTLLNGKYAPEARAALLLRRHQPVQAAQMLDRVGRLMFRDLDAPFLRATALLEAGDATAAAAGFRSVLAQAGFGYDPQFMLADLGLARALRLQGDLAGSEQAYRAFLARWKSADPDLPALKQAKGELAALVQRATAIAAAAPKPPSPPRTGTAARQQRASL